MTDQSAPDLSSTDSIDDAQAAFFELSEKARQFSINPDRPFFPVNSMRLLYFLILEKITASNEAIDLMNELIPRIEAVLSARDIDVQLATFAQHLPHIQQKNEGLLHQLLDLRAADSVLLSTLLCELIRKFRPSSLSETDQRQLETYLHWQLHLIYQLNDLVDSVVFAKDDLENKSFSPILIVQEITHDPIEAKSILAQVITQLMERSTAVHFPDLDTTLQLYQQVLRSVLIPTPQATNYSPTA